MTTSDGRYLMKKNLIIISNRTIRITRHKDRQILSSAYLLNLSDYSRDNRSAVEVLLDNKRTEHEIHIE